MKRYLNILLFVLSLFFAFFCSKQESQPGADASAEASLPEITTGDADNPTATSITLYGCLDADSQTSGDLKFGILYSTDRNPDKSNATLVHSNNLEFQGWFTVTITTGLAPDTEYYYRAFVENETGSFRYGEVKSFKTSPLPTTITAEVSEISYNRATISGKVTPGSKDVSAVSATLYYSSTANTLEKLKSSGVPESLSLNPSGQYIVSANSLTWGTTCYYAVIAIENGVESSTGVQSLNTLTVPYTSSINAYDSGFGPVTVSGSLNVSSSFTFNKTVSIYYSSTAKTVETLKSSGKKEDVDLDSKGWFSKSIRNLTVGTKYYYCVCATIAGKEVALNPGEFTPARITGSANCYVVKPNASITFPAVKGNGNISVGKVSKMSVLWETFCDWNTPKVGDVVKSATFRDGKITVTAGLEKGNAVVAATDASGNILWSWHIWVTEESPGLVRQSNGYSVMDRNLGSLVSGESMPPFGSNYRDLAAGMLYQWGRKDPFPGGAQTGTDRPGNTYRQKTNLIFPLSVSSDSETGNISYSLQHPTTFIKENQNNHDWCCSGSSTVDITRWKTTKTIYDPCPAGYRVPQSDVWRGCSPADTYFIDIGTGISLYIGGWYPFSGCLSSTNGLFAGGASVGYCWSCTPTTLDTYRMNALYLFYGYTDKQSTVYEKHPAYCANGLSVRCVKE